MSWSDLFFPGNPGRRNEVVRLFTQLLTHMEGNFKTTNDLIAMIRKHLPGKTFQRINVDHDLTIRENCDTFITRTTEIQPYITEKKKEIKQKLDTKLYRQIMDTNVTFAQKLELGRKITGAVLASIGTATGLGICACIKKGKILVSMVEKFSKLKVLAVAGIAIEVAFLAVDMIASAIIGAIERDKLEESIQDLKAALDIFEPGSREYTRQITKMEVTIELFAEMGML